MYQHLIDYPDVTFADAAPDGFCIDLRTGNVVPLANTLWGFNPHMFPVSTDVVDCLKDSDIFDALKGQKDNALKLVLHGEIGVQDEIRLNNHVIISGNGTARLVSHHGGKIVRAEGKQNISLNGFHVTGSGMENEYLFLFEFCDNVRVRATSAKGIGRRGIGYRSTDHMEICYNLVDGVKQWHCCSSKDDFDNSANMTDRERSQYGLIYSNIFVRAGYENNGGNCLDFHAHGEVAGNWCDRKDGTYTAKMPDAIGLVHHNYFTASPEKMKVDSTHRSHKPNLFYIYNTMDPIALREGGSVFLAKNVYNAGGKTHDGKHIVRDSNLYALPGSPEASIDGAITYGTMVDQGRAYVEFFDPNSPRPDPPDGETPPITPDELRAMIREVVAEYMPARVEEIVRQVLQDTTFRAQLN